MGSDSGKTAEKAAAAESVLCVRFAGLRGYNGDDVCHDPAGDYCCH